MADNKDEILAQLKKKLTLIRVSISNAVRHLNEGRVVPASTIDDLYTQETQILKQIERLEKEEDTPPPPSESSGEAGAEEEEYGIPKELRIMRRPYTMTEEARQQRQNAAKSPAKADAMKGNRNAWKHGQYAEGLVRSVFPPCKTTCRHFKKCEHVANGETEPGEICLDNAQLIKNLQAVEKAMRDGQLGDLKDLAAVQIAGGIEVIQRLIADILTDGTLVKSLIFGKDGQQLGYKVMNHPSLLPLWKGMEVLGITPTNFMITPQIVKKFDTEEKVANTLGAAMGRAAAAAQRAREKKPQQQ
ncbi:MAG: hypothetical protein AB1553_01965 [Nitrospirota bacterium]